MSEKVYVGKGMLDIGEEWQVERRLELKHLARIDTFFMGQGEYLILRRDLPKPKEEKCPELLPGDVVSFRTVSPNQESTFLVKKKEGCQITAAWLSNPPRSEVFHECYMTEPLNRPLSVWRNGKKIWWKGKLEGQEV